MEKALVPSTLQGVVPYTLNPNHLFYIFQFGGATHYYHSHVPFFNLLSPITNTTTGPPPPPPTTTTHPERQPPPPLLHHHSYPLPQMSPIPPQNPRPSPPSSAAAWRRLLCSSIATHASASSCSHHPLPNICCFSLAVIVVNKRRGRIILFNWVSFLINSRVCAGGIVLAWLGSIGSCKAVLIIRFQIWSATATSIWKFLRL